MVDRIDGGMGGTSRPASGKPYQSFLAEPFFRDFDFEDASRLIAEGHKFLKEHENRKFAINKFTQAINLLDQVAKRQYVLLPFTQKAREKSQTIQTAARLNANKCRELIRSITESARVGINIDDVPYIQAHVLVETFGPEGLEEPNLKELVNKALEILGVAPDKKDEVLCLARALPSKLAKLRGLEFTNPEEIEDIKRYGITEQGEVNPEIKYNGKTINEIKAELSAKLTGEEPLPPPISPPVDSPPPSPPVSRNVAEAIGALTKEGVTEAPLVPESTSGNTCTALLQAPEDYTILRAQPINMEQIKADFTDKNDHALYFIEELIKDGLIVNPAQAEALSIVARADGKTLAAIRSRSFSRFPDDIQKVFLGRILDSGKPAFVPAKLLSDYLDFYNARVRDPIHKYYERWVGSYQDSVPEAGKLISGKINDPFHGEPIGGEADQARNILELIEAARNHDVVTNSGTVKLLTQEEYKVLKTMISEYKIFSEDYRGLRDGRKQNLADRLTRIARNKLDQYGLDVLNLTRGHVLRKGNEPLPLLVTSEQLPTSISNIRKWMGLKPEVPNLEQYLYSRHPELLATLVTASPAAALPPSTPAVPSLPSVPPVPAPPITPPPGRNGHEAVKPAAPSSVKLNIPEDISPFAGNIFELVVSELRKGNT